jgi:predicted transcriptional regulator
LALCDDGVRIRRSGVTTGNDGDTAIEETLRLAGEEKLLEMAAEPLTRQVLSMTVKRPVSPREIAAEVERPVEEVRQHLEELRRAGLINLEETRGADEAPEPFFHGPYVPFLDREEWEELDPEMKRLHLRLIIRLLNGDLEEAMSAGTLTAWPDFHLCRIPLRMDRQGWDELGEVYDAAFLRAMQIKEEAAKRVDQSGGEGVRGTAATLLFEMPELE